MFCFTFFEVIGKNTSAKLKLKKKRYKERKTTLNDGIILIGSKNI